MNQQEQEINQQSAEEKIEYCDGYKTYHGCKFVITFPDEWILNEKKDTGRECENCYNINCEGIANGFGMWRGIFIGYCRNCAEYDYEFTRGFGFDGQAVENITFDYKRGIYNNDSSATYGYLSTIDFETLGDIKMNPEDILENKLRFYQKEIDYYTYHDEYLRLYQEEIDYYTYHDGYESPC